jgi:hypothetical protein
VIAPRAARKPSVTVAPRPRFALVQDRAQGELRVRGHDPGQDRARVVAADVVDEQDLEGEARLLERVPDLGEARLEVLRLVVAREHQAEVRGLANQTPRGAPRRSRDRRRVGEPRVQRQAQERGGHALGDRQLVVRAEPAALGRGVERDVVERRHDAARAQRLERAVAARRSG